MPMPGGWVMPMTWMRMPGQTWTGASAAFLAMWVAMMTAMMLPSLVPALASYRGSVSGTGEPGAAGLTSLVGAGYFLAWTAIGALVFPLGAAFAAAEMRWEALSRAVPVAGGFLLVAAGAVQFSPWKARRLDRCRDAPGCRDPLVAGPAGALRRGIRLGWHCGLCCATYTAVLCLAGLGNLAAMVLVAAAITLERLVPRPRWIVHASGAAVTGWGLLVIARALIRA